MTVAAIRAMEGCRRRGAGVERLPCDTGGRPPRSAARCGVLAAVLAAAVCAGAERKLSREDFAQLFNGKLVQADKTGSIGLVYDFSDPLQFEDFSDYVPPKRPKEGLALDEKILVAHKGRFEGDITLAMKIDAGGGPCQVFVFLDPTADEGYVFLFGVKDDTGASRSWNGVGKYRRGREPDLIYQGSIGTWQRKSYSIDISRKGETLEMKLDKRVIIKTKDKTYKSGQIAFNGDFVLRRLSVTGRLNLAWCDKALSGDLALDSSEATEALMRQYLEGIGDVGPMTPELRLQGLMPAWETVFRKASEHYRVVTNVSDAQAERYARLGDAMYAMYAKVFPGNVDASQASMIVVFKTREEFVKFGAPEQVLGFYYPSSRNLFLFDHVNPTITQMVLLHEGFHQYLHLLVEKPPLWFNEGMASYFETATLEKDGFRIGAPSLRLRRLATMLEKGSPPPLSEFVAITDEEFRDPQSLPDNYAMAWGLCHFFVHFEKGKYRPALNNYFQALRRGVSSEEACAKLLLPLNWKKIEEEWRTYILALYRTR